MKRLVSLIAILLCLISCSTRGQLEAAAQELKELGSDNAVYCWAGGEPFQCRSVEAAADETACIKMLSNSRGWVEQSPLEALVTCMSSKGWIQFHQYTLHVNT